MGDIKVVLLGCGTPNAEPWANGPAYAVIIDGKVYLVDAGAGIVRGCTTAFYNGIEELRPQNLTHVFLTHLHSDHTVGLADLILTPWVLEREKQLHVFGPKGTEEMCAHLLKAYEKDTDFRNDGPEPINHTGCQVTAHPLCEGIVFQDGALRAAAFRTAHGMLESYGFVFEAYGKKIVFSGDTKPLEKMKQIAYHADLLIHEAEYTAGVKDRTPAWQNYHRSIHTMSEDLAEIMNAAEPRLTVTTHRILHLNYYGEKPVEKAEIRRREDALLKEIQKITPLPAVNGSDQDVFLL